MNEKSSKNPSIPNNIHCIILAAGIGTRMKSQKSKVLHEVSGKPMVEIVLELARLVGIKTTVVASNENHLEIEKLLQNNHERIVIQNERLGTGHAVATAIEEIEKSNAEKIVILYGDTPLVTKETVEKMALENNDVTFLGFEEIDTSNKYGRLILDEHSTKLHNNERGRLLAIVEYKDANEEQKSVTICNSGVVCISKNTLINALKKLKPSEVTGEYYLTDVVSIANYEGEKCGFLKCEKSEVLGVNSREDLSVVDNIMQKRIKSLHMQNGVTFLLPKTSYVFLGTKIGQDVIIQQNCFLGKNVEIKDNVEIRAFSHLEGCVVEFGAFVGPFARIRPNTIIEENAGIGNFVEVKNSTIGRKSKAGHLSYIGDSQIGENVNIGAGTVFCNYNGFKKFESKVGDGSFVGSNSTIISPVEIAKGTIVAAGSVITKSTQENSLAISRSGQVEIANGGEKFRKKHGK